MDLREALRPPVVVAYLLFCVFGIGSWVALNGVWAEISLLVLTLPECAKLPAILVVVIQVANVGPLAYTGVRYLFRRFGWNQLNLEVTMVFVLVAVGVASCVLLAVFWSETAFVFGRDHSVALIALSFCLALVDCTSSVVFVPFLKHFPAIYISGLYIGEGLSGVLPSVVSLSQGFVNDSLQYTCLESYPGVSALGINFSPNVYFIFLTAMMVLCGVAFLAIIALPIVRRQMIPCHAVSDDAQPSGVPSESSSADSQPVEEDESSRLKAIDEEEDEGVAKLPLDSESGEASPELPLIDNPQGTETNVKKFRVLDRHLQHCAQSQRCPTMLRILWRNFTILFCLSLLAFLANGSLAAISAYVYLPYGSTTFHLAINLGLLANPVATLVFVFLPHKSRRVTIVLSSLACLLGIYVLVVALLSPNPPLKDNLGGQILIVLVSVLISALVSYTKVGVIVQLHAGETDRDTALLLSGIVTQAGSLLGAVLFFVLVNFAGIFNY